MERDSRLKSVRTCCQPERDERRDEVNGHAKLGRRMSHVF